MPSIGAMPGLIGRKVGMMTLYDGSGRARGVTVVDVSGNRVTQIRTPERDGYIAVQVGGPGKRKRLTRPERGHLRSADAGREVLSELREFRVTDPEPFEPGQKLSVSQFEPGSYLDVTGTSKGRGFAGVVRRWNFRGGPKTHGQSDRHRAPGSIGAGTTPGRVWKGQKMGGHMGNRRRTSLNALLVYADADRDLLFIEGSVAGPINGIVTVRSARRPRMTDFQPPVLDLPEIELPEPELPELDLSESERPENEMAVEDEAADDVAADDVATDDVATDDVATDDVATDDVATDDVATDDVATDETTRQDSEAEAQP